MSWMMNGVSSMIASVTTTTHSAARPTAAAAASTQPPPAEHNADDFDMMHDLPSVELYLEQSGVTVSVPMSWGQYVPRLAAMQSVTTTPKTKSAPSPSAAAAAAAAHQPQAAAVKVSFGTARAHELVASYFAAKEPNQPTSQPSKAWEEAKEKCRAYPPLLLELLQYSWGLGSHHVFQEACTIFYNIFKSLNLTFPDGNGNGKSSVKLAIEQCGEKIRRGFQLNETTAVESAAATSQRTAELVGYFFVECSLSFHSLNAEQLRKQEPTQDANLSDIVKNIPDTFRHRVWQPDSESTQCPKCHRYFADTTLARVATWIPSMDYRAPSHCRVCGLRVCDDCTQFRVEKSIARLSHPDSAPEPEQRPSCVDCYREAKRALQFAYLGHVFVFAGLSLLEIAMLRTACGEWNAAAELVLHDVRAALYSMHEPSGAVSHPPIAAQKAMNNLSCGVLAALSDASTPSTSTAVEQSTSLLQLSHAKISQQDVFSKVYSSSARLFIGHPEHVMRLLAVLDWTRESDVLEAQRVVVSTVEVMRRHLPCEHHHWHLLCTRWCRGVNVGVFGAHCLQVIATQVRREKCVLSTDVVGTAAVEMAKALADGLKTAKLDFETRCSLVPLLLDIYCGSDWLKGHVEDVLFHFSSVDPACGLQVLCDYRSRPKSAKSNGFSSDDQIKFRLEQSAGSGTNSNATKLMLSTVRFMDCIEAVMTSPGAASQDEVGIRMRLLAELFSRGFIDERGAMSGAVPFRPSSQIMHPFRKGITLSAIHVNDIRIMSSKVRPVMFTLEDTAGVRHKLLWKQEPMRQDYIVCLIGAYSQRLLVDAEKLKAAASDGSAKKGSLHASSTTYRFSNLVSYMVLPFSADSGFIQCVSDAETIRKVIDQEMEKSSALNREKGGGEAVANSPQSPLLRYLTSLPNQKAVRRTFLESSKFFVLFNYMLTIRDRHRENVLVTHDGSIFHIDFGMILHEKTLAETATAYVRFDSDLEACIKHYALEEARCVEERKQAQAQAAPAPAAPAVAAAAPRDADVTRAVLGEIADWLNVIRPHAPFLFHLLRHHLRVKAQHGYDPTWDTAVASPAAVAEANRLEEFKVKDLIFNTIFMRTHADATCTKNFIDRVLGSKGKEVVKDLTHDGWKKFLSFFF